VGPPTVYRERAPSGPGMVCQAVDRNVDEVLDIGCRLGERSNFRAVAPDRRSYDGW